MFLLFQGIFICATWFAQLLARAFYCCVGRVGVMRGNLSEVANGRFLAGSRNRHTKFGKTVCCQTLDFLTRND